MGRALRIAGQSAAALARADSPDRRGADRHRTLSGSRPDGDTAARCPDRPASVEFVEPALAPRRRRGFSACERVRRPDGPATTGSGAAPTLAGPARARRTVPEP